MSVVTFTPGTGAVEKKLLTCDQCGDFSRPLFLHRGSKRFFCGTCKPN